MYDIIARRRLSTVLRYIFDFLPKEETSIHLNTKKAVLSDRRNSDTEPYIMLNIFFVEDIFSPRWAEANKSRRRTLSGFCLPGPRQTSFPLPLFSLTFRLPLFYCTTVCVSKLFNTAPAPLRRQTNQDTVHCPTFIFLFPGKLRFPFRSFLAFRSPLFTAPPYAFLNSSMPTRLRYGGRQSRRRTLSGLYLPVPGKLRFPFRSFLVFRLPLFTAPPYAFQNSSIPTRLRYGNR